MQNASGGEQIHMASSAEMAFDRMQNASTLAQYAPGVNAGELVDGLGEMFARCAWPG